MNRLFGQIMRFYYPVILNFARKLVVDDGAAEDIAAETFIKLWQNRQNLTTAQSMKAFLFITSKNSCLNELRSSKRAAIRNATFASSVEIATPLIEEALIESEAMAVIVQASTFLPDRMKQVFELSFLEGLSNHEIAQRLNLSTNTVRNQKNRAVEQIKQRVKGTLLFPLILAMIQ